MSKGSKRRPQMVNEKTMSQNWNAAFPTMPTHWQTGELSEENFEYENMICIKTLEPQMWSCIITE
jgi:hypothetical protein